MKARARQCHLCRIHFELLKQGAGYCAGVPPIGLGPSTLWLDFYRDGTALLLPYCCQLLLSSPATCGCRDSIRFLRSWLMSCSRPPSTVRAPDGEVPAARKALKGRPPIKTGEAPVIAFCTAPLFPFPPVACLLFHCALSCIFAAAIGCSTPSLLCGNLFWIM